MLRDEEDAFGHEMLDYLEKGEAVEIIERDDGFIDVSGGAKAYFAEYEEWPSHQKEAMAYVNGRVLDVGCGAGRVALYLQEKGLEVLGIDNSPLAIDVCKRRGLKKCRVLPVTRVSSRLGVFDTILMFGNNFGLFGSPRRARWLLRRFGNMTSLQGRIIAESNDVHKTEIPEHLVYHEFNRKRGRMPGQVRIRVRYRRHATPWFDYLMVSKEEMRGILADTGWRVSGFLDSEGSPYIAVIEKT